MGQKYKVSFGNNNSNNPYLGKSKDELLDMYTPEVWDQLDNSEKLNLLAATGEVYSAEHGIDNPPVFEEETDATLCGGYTGCTNTVSVNLEVCDNPYEALDTVAHEVNHAYQKQSIEKGNGTYSEKERALMKAERAAYRSWGPAYDRQSLEQDSNNAGAKYVLESKDKFKSKAAFQDYLRSREEYFSQVAADYMSNYREHCASEMKQVEDAYARGLISMDERDQAISCIVDQENSVKEEMLNMQEEIQAAHYETALDKECQADLKGIAKEQHQQFDLEMGNANPDKDAMIKIHEKNGNTLKNLNYTKDALSKEYADKFEKVNQYVRENNLTQEECQNDPKFQVMSRELADLRVQKDSCAYHIAELETDNTLISQTFPGEFQQSGQTNGPGCGQQSGATSKLDNGQQAEMAV